MNSFLKDLTPYEIGIRIIISIFIGGIIGYEREARNRPAGFRTHILVCLGATTVSMIQDQLRINLHNYALLSPEVSQILKTDLGRIGAQVVSGIGFLGAGTIMRDKGVIEGLTTAASIWATGCLGLSIGWGFYHIAILAGIAVIVVLAMLKNLEHHWIKNKTSIKLSIYFIEGLEYSEVLLKNYEIFQEKYIRIKNIEKNLEERKIDYLLIPNKQTEIMEILHNLSTYPHISKVKIP